MKYRTLKTAMLAAAAILLLASCTSSENTDVQNSGTAQQSADGMVQQSADGTGALTGDASKELQVYRSDSYNLDTSGADSRAPADSAPGSAQGNTASELPAGEITDDMVAPGTPVEDGGPVGDIVPDEDADAAEAEDEVDAGRVLSDEDDIWTGIYISDKERIKLELLDAERLSFAFKESGISGIAEIKKEEPEQAVFKGDDYHVIVFTMEEGVLKIEVASEEDFDTSESPLIGTYVRTED